MSKSLVIKPTIPSSLKRTIYRMLYKLIQHDQTLHHNRRYWPYYQVERDQSGRLQRVIFNKQSVIDQRNLSHQSKPQVILVATGPSIRQLPLHFFDLPDYDYMGVNGAIALTQAVFKYYVLIDHNFIQNRFDLVIQVISSVGILFTTPRCLDEILRQISFDEIKRQIFLIETITDHQQERLMANKLKIDAKNSGHFYLDGTGFSKDIGLGVFDYYTVAYCALQICYALNFEQIFIVGLDMNNLDQPRFYEQKGHVQQTYLHMYQPQIMQVFDTAAQFFSDANIKVYNLSAQSAVKSFTMLDASTLLNQ